VEYASPEGRRLLADVYVPTAAAERMPAIVWLHGGGWQFGDRRRGPDLSRYFAERGFVMASIDYRLSGEAVFPAQAEDVKTALRWLRAHAAQYHVAPDRIGLWGSSAGGHLAALAALSSPGVFEGSHGEHAGFSSRVHAVVSGYAPIDFLKLDTHRALMAQPEAGRQSARLAVALRAADPDSFESRLMGEPIERCAERVRQANPITYVGTGAPPFLILHGLRDAVVPWHQSQLLYDALASHDNDATLCLVEGLGHGFLDKGDFDRGTPHDVTVRRCRPGRPEQVTDGPAVTFHAIEAFFRRHLLGEPGEAETAP